MYFPPRDKIKRLFPASALISLLLLGTISLNCNNLELQSQWRDSVITIDGNHTEWEGALKYSEEERATVGFFNDDEYLYLCLLSADQQVLMQAMAAGFTVWFEGTGKKDERLIVKYPIGETMPRRESFQPGENERADRIAEVLRQQTEIVLTQADHKKELKLSELEDYGLEAKIGQHLGRMVYEIRVPLHRSDKIPYAINARAGKPVKVGFELGKLEMPEMERRPSGWRMGKGGTRPGGGGMGRGGPRGGRRPDQPPEFKFELSVKLAKKAATADY